MTMYKVLYEAWLKEKDSARLQKLPKDFYAKLAEYIRKVRQERRMLDKKSTKAELISQEFENVKRLLEELGRIRFEKLVDLAVSEESLVADEMPVEEEDVLKSLRPLYENFQSLVKESLRGRASAAEKKTRAPKRKTVRFLFFSELK